MLAIWWIKRDFRLDDNPALCAAIESCEKVVPVYFLESDIYRAADASAFHLQSQLSALRDLQESLRKTGAELLVIQSNLPQGFVWLRSQLHFTHIFSHEETGANITFERDKRVARWCKSEGIIWQELPQSSVVRRLSSRDKRQEYIKSRLLDSRPLGPPAHINQPNLEHLHAYRQVPRLQDVAADLIYPEIDWSSVQVVSEKRAGKTLQSFLHERGVGYRGGISSPNKAFFYGSRLSPHIAWGTVSLRRIFFLLNQRLQLLDDQLEKNPDDLMLKKWTLSLESFSSRLYWRDHFVQRLESSSSMEFRALNPAYEQVRYVDNPDLLQAWLNGSTGFPLIDACMRCLKTTGFLNFRMRAMLVNFACFGLHIDWKQLQYPLAKYFVDYEPGIHFSQIQMQAAIVGINSLRVYNPLKQLVEQDLKCQFIKRWLPELRGYTPEQIALHGDFPLAGYAKQQVNADDNIRIMKQQISAIRKSTEGQIEASKVLEQHGSRLRRNKKRVMKKIHDSNNQMSFPLE